MYTIKKHIAKIIRIISVLTLIGGVSTSFGYLVDEEPLIAFAIFIGSIIISIFIISYSVIIEELKENTTKQNEIFQQLIKFNKSVKTAVFENKLNDSDNQDKEN